MSAFLEWASRFYAFEYFGLVIVLVLLEWGRPRREAGASLLHARWFGNVGIAVVDAVVLRWMFPLAGAAWAAWCQQRGWGLLNQFSVSLWLSVPVTLLVIDLNGYVLHYLGHRIPWLWRLHRTHHTDQAFDFTTGFRFHPIDSVLTTAVSMAVTFLLGAPPEGVLLSSAVTLASALFAHSNLQIPAAVDRVLRLVVVTPELHETHHSRVRVESQSNLGVVVPWWDRLFGTYLEAPLNGPDRLEFGVHGFTEPRHLRLDWILWSPFVKRQRRAESSANAQSESKTAA